MKYCEKCENELFDEAVICPKCGCPVKNIEKNNLEEKRQLKIKTGKRLNIIASILNLALAAYVAKVLFLDDIANSNADVVISIGPEPNAEWFGLWVILLIVLFVLGLRADKWKNTKLHKYFGYIYFLITILAIIIMFITVPELLTILMLGIGIPFAVPACLQIIASIKFVQGMKKKED